VVKWIDTDGEIQTSVNMMPPNARSIANSASLTNGTEKGDDSAGTSSAAVANNTFYPTFTDQAIDHSQAEVARNFQTTEFGNGAANGGTGASGNKADASMLKDVSDNIAYVMDDGLTSIAGYEVGRSEGSHVYIYAQDASRGCFFTFIGTGFTMTGRNTSSAESAPISIVQNLPYGTHIVKIYAGGTHANTTFVVDGIEVYPESNALIRYGGVIQVTFHQPKMPPIPEDAVVIADYMLMADFVPLSSTSYGLVSKGTRGLGLSRDVACNTAGTLDLSGAEPYGFNLYGTNMTVRLPMFATNYVQRGYQSDTRTELYRDASTSLDSSATKDNTATMESYAHLTSDIVLGLHNLGWNAASGSNANSSRIEIVSPIHTSSHYQTFETPFLYELVGGDRNMEQTNLVVTPDGKTWDEVTRDTSYIGNGVLSGNVEGGGQSGIVILDEWRGTHAGSSSRVSYNKDWAIAYDRVICLVEGQYEVNVGTLNNDQHQKVRVNANSGTQYLIQNHNAGSDNITISGVATHYFEKGDYITIEVMGGSSNYNTFEIKRV